MYILYLFNKYKYYIYILHTQYYIYIIYFFIKKFFENNLNINYELKDI